MAAVALPLVSPNKPSQKSDKQADDELQQEITGL